MISQYKNKNNFVFTITANEPSDWKAITEDGIRNLIQAKKTDFQLTLI